MARLKMSDIWPEESKLPRPMGRPPLGKDMTAINIKIQRQWYEWFHRFCKAEQMSGPELIDRALAEYAFWRRFEGPPER